MCQYAKTKQKHERGHKSNNGFTLIELLVVIVIIAILATLAFVAIGSARARARDAKRIADIKQLQTALELYSMDAGSYPAEITPGQPLEYDGKVYMKKVPSNPVPWIDGACTGNNDYDYTVMNGGTSYAISYCLANGSGDLASGSYSAVPGQIGTSCNSDCVSAGRCAGDTDNCGKTCASNPSSSVTVSNVVATANAGRTTITVTWDALSYANTTYKLEYSQSTNGGSTWTAFANVTGATALTTNTYSHTSRNASYQYKYRVTPTVCSSVVGSASSESNASGCVLVATAPSTITLTPNYQQVIISWTAVSGASQYKVYGNTSGTPTLKYTGSNLVYTESGLTNGSTYYYSVVATVCGIDSSKSAEQSAVPNTDFTVACNSNMALVASCGGGWLICKPNDGNCADSSSNYVVVSPVENSYVYWINAVTTCNSFSNGGYSGWVLPRLSSNTAISTTLSGSRTNNELCQMMRRSNLCASMTSTSYCNGGCLSPAPINLTNASHWSINEYSSTKAWYQTPSGDQLGQYGDKSVETGIRLRCVKRF